jgi:hypothetical protein
MCLQQFLHPGNGPRAGILSARFLPHGPALTVGQRRTKELGAHELHCVIVHQVVTARPHTVDGLHGHRVLRHLNAAQDTHGHAYDFIIYTLKARDLIHAAVMLENGLSRILSTDAHFDQVSEVERIDPCDFAGGELGNP